MTVEAASTGGANALDIVIAGSSASLAVDLVAALVRRGHRVRVVDGEQPRQPPEPENFLVPPADPGDLRAAVATADATVLLAGLGPVTAKVEDAAALDVILGAARPGSTLIVTSSLAVFADLSGATVDESSQPCVPPGLESLRAGEVRTLAANDWLRTIVVRLGLVYGPGGGPVIRSAVDRARELGVSVYVGHPDDAYPLVHSDDLADLLIRLIEHDTARGVFHAVTARCTAGLLASLVADIAGVDRVEPGQGPWLWTPLPLGTPPPRVNHHAITVRAAEAGWRPTAPTLGEEVQKIPLG